MSYEDYYLRMEKLKDFISHEHTGNSGELAKKLGISRRTLFLDLGKLRDTGMPVQYDWHRETYYVKQRTTEGEMNDDGSSEKT